MNFKQTFMAFFIAFIVIAALMFTYILKTGRKPLPYFQQVTHFSLTDTQNKEVSADKLRGKVWVANFIFSTCSDICPVMTKNIASLHRSYVLLDDVRMVSISVNPENDSPEVLNEYAKKFDADTSKWLFLTGDRAEISDLAVNTFKIGKIDEPVFHSPHLALVDRFGFIRGYYDGTDDEAIAELFKDIAYLRKESKTGFQPPRT